MLGRKGSQGSPPAALHRGNPAGPSWALSQGGQWLGCRRGLGLGCSCSSVVSPLPHWVLSTKMSNLWARCSPLCKRGEEGLFWGTHSHMLDSLNNSAQDGGHSHGSANRGSRRPNKPQEPGIPDTLLRAEVGGVGEGDTTAPSCSQDSTLSSSEQRFPEPSATIPP